MRCPFCSHPDTQVKDSRVTEDGYTIRRRRSCSKCGSRFTTIEQVQMRELIVVKKNDVRVPFEREKLYRSILLALRKRQIDNHKVAQLVNRIVRQLESAGEQEIRSSQRIQAQYSVRLKLKRTLHFWQRISTVSIPATPRRIPPP